LPAISMHTIGQQTATDMKTKLYVPIQVRDLAVIGIDNAEKALAFLLDAATKTKSHSSDSSASIALLKRVVHVQMNYARTVAHAKDLSEATAMHFAYCRAQIEITTELIRLASESTN
jgi:hypothetical protein